MRPIIRNTTALVALVSLAAPVSVQAQSIVEVCADGQTGVPQSAFEEAGVPVPVPFQRVYAGEPGSPMLQLTQRDGERVLCLDAQALAQVGVGPAQAEALLGGQATAGAAVSDEQPAAQAQAEPAPAQAVEEAQEQATEEATPPKTDAQVGDAETAEEPVAQAEATQETAEPQAAEAQPEQPKVGQPAPDGPVTAEAPKPAPSSGREDVPQTEAQAALDQQMQQIEQQAAEAVDPAQEAEVAEAEAPQTAVAATDEATQGAATVEEETVTESDARSSSEEFDSSLSTTAQPQNGDGGISKLDKALAIGLGAVIVGQALRGNSDARVVQKSDDRVVVLEDGRYRVIRDDNELIERPGSDVKRETFADGSSRTTVTRPNGVQIVTVRDAELRVLRRVRIAPDGSRTVLIDDTAQVAAVDVTALPDAAPDITAQDDLRAALAAEATAGRRFALYQVRNIGQVRKLAPAIALDAINFRTGSAVIDPEEARELSELGQFIADAVARNPGEVFLIEGHTDAVGNAAYNLALSDRRAESVALALTEYFDVPPENLVVQGYGESDLKVRTLEAERANRRAAVRRITPLLRDSD